MGLLYTDNSVRNNNTTKITACSGGIYKTYKESWFERFNLKSYQAERLLDEGNKSEIILQMVICGDMEVIAEIIKEKDFNKYFGELEEGNSNE